MHAAPAVNPDGENLKAEDLRLSRDGEPNLDVGDLISAAFEIVKANPTETIGYGAAIAVAMFFLSMVSQGVTFGMQMVVGESAQGDVGMALLPSLLSMPISFATSILQAVLGAAYAIIWLRLIRGQEVSFESMYVIKDMWGQIAVASILMNLIMLTGMFLCIIPGVIAMLGLILSPYMVIDKNLSGVEALKASWEVTTGYKGSIFVALLVLGLLNILGVLTCGLGLLVTMPINVGGMALIYDRMTVPGNYYSDEPDDLADVFA